MMGVDLQFDLLKIFSRNNFIFIGAVYSEIMSNKLEYILKDYIFHIEKVINYSPNTIVSYKRDLNSFLLFCKKIKIDNISFLDEKIVRDFVSHLHRNGIGPKSIKRSLSSLRSFFNFMLKKKLLK